MRKLHIKLRRDGDRLSNEENKSIRSNKLAKVHTIGALM